uniref:Acetylornithine deacetylase n=1 Tax=Globodera rostochiensis TaxID=31243 RepID=A0A914GNP1_GLORO
MTDAVIQQLTQVLQQLLANQQQNPALIAPPLPSLPKWNVLRAAWKESQGLARPFGLTDFSASARGSRKMRTLAHL